MPPRPERRRRNAPRPPARGHALVDAVRSMLAGVIAYDTERGAVLLDPSGRVTWVNPIASGILGYAPEELVGRQPSATFYRPRRVDGSPETEWDATTLGSAVARGLVRRVDADRFVCGDGSAVPVSYVLAPLRESGVLLGAYLSFERAHDEGVDLVERPWLDTRFRRLVERLPVAVYYWEVSHGGECLYISPRIADLVGHTPSEWLADSSGWRDAVHPDDREATIQAEALATVTGELSVEYRFHARDGRTVWVRDHAVTIYADDGTPLYFQGFIEDITQRKEAETRLARDATTDIATGLPNRLAFVAALDDAHARSGHHAVLFIDLDRFKVLNDSFGHAAGDAVLLDVARRLPHALRTGDVLSRFGGDEFTVLLRDTDRASAEAVAERLLEILDEPFRLPHGESFLTASIGIALAEPGATPTDLVRNADAAMYRAKELGKARYALFDHRLRAGAQLRQETEDDLRQALDRGQLRVLFQPIVRLADGVAESLETLLRWQHPTRGLLPPSEFITIAEEAGLIVEIDRWVIGEACRQARELERAIAGRAPLPRFNVNVSARHPLGADLTRTVIAALDASGLDPGRLCLELTESALIADTDLAAASLADVRGHGVMVALDDFGVGWSSLNHLRQLPVDLLKIDRSFVSGLPQSAIDRALVTAIVTLARSMGIAAIAEGVERAPQRDLLRELQCDYGQGYLFARPCEPGALVPMLLGSGEDAA